MRDLSSIIEHHLQQLSDLNYHVIQIELQSLKVRSNKMYPDND